MSRLNEYQIGDRVHAWPMSLLGHAKGTVLGYIYYGGYTTIYHVLWDGLDEAEEVALPKGARV
jgi:hypothetical protein